MARVLITGSTDGLGLMAGRILVSQFTLRRDEDGSWLASVIRHFSIDRPDPR